MTTMDNARHSAVHAATAWNERRATSLEVRPIDEVYGRDSFGPRMMRERLPKEIYRKLMKTMKLGEPLHADVADVLLVFGPSDDARGHRRGVGAEPGPVENTGEPVDQRVPVGIQGFFDEVTLGRSKHRGTRARR